MFIPRENKKPANKLRNIFKSRIQSDNHNNLSKIFLFTNVVAANRRDITVVPTTGTINFENSFPTIVIFALVFVFQLHKNITSLNKNLQHWLY